MAISNNRIVKIHDGKVTFRYKETKKQKNEWTRKWQTMELPVFEFMRRFLQHVLPAGFHKVRYYGLLSPANRKLVQRLQLLLASPVTNQDIDDLEDRLQQHQDASENICCSCNHGIMQIIGYFPRLSGLYARAPPTGD